MTPREHKPHCGDAVAVGDYTIYLGGMQYDQHGFEPLVGFDLIVPLEKEWLETLKRPEDIGVEISKELFMKDFAGVPEDWSSVLESVLIPRLEAGKKIVVFCKGGHGRTGTVLASLIALLEPEVEDPIRAARERYCLKAVETVAQAEAIFSLKSERLPDNYFGTFII